MSREYFDLCSCGSGQMAYAVRDTEGIFVTYACDSCRVDRLKNYSDLCHCGSGQIAYVVRDATDAVIALACDSCREERLRDHLQDQGAHHSEHDKGTHRAGG